ncbi:MAG TPA: CotH kinase family protein [Saprospiraceae bacterium]|nr:CotH kinase family protein [Saprospiraceae bacterium]
MNSKSRIYFINALLLLTCFHLKAQIIRSNLPLLLINTNGLSIPDEYKITAQMKVVDLGKGKEHTDTSTTFAFDGIIGIELRGSSSQSFPKKPYGIEIKDDKGEDKDESFFGWPKESDYVLFASYNEKSLMHNVLTMNLAREFGMYASRTRYVEVILNGNYQGVYVFMEKVKRDKGRVDIDKLDDDENSGDDLTGGYIMKIDKVTGSIGGSFTSDFKSQYGKDIHYQYDTPKAPTSQQVNYIQNFIRTFENSVNNANYKDPDVGYRKYADVESFVKYFLINEFARNMDGFRISTFLHKDKDSRGGKLKMGPVWDFDICYGNANYCEGNRYDLYAHGFNAVCSNDFFQVPFWWNKLLADPYFLDLTRTIYTKERTEGIFKMSRINALIDSLKLELGQAQVRNYEKWPILGTYVWPQPDPIPASWEGEINELTNWIPKRLEFLDKMFLIKTDTEESTYKKEIRVYPNPVDEQSIAYLPDGFDEVVKIKVFDALGRVVAQINSYHTSFGLSIPLQDLFDLQSLSRTGVYFMEVIDLHDRRATIKLLRK